MAEGVPEAGTRGVVSNTSAQQRLDELKTHYARLRERYIAEGVLPDPERPGTLHEAERLVGTCEDMCPEYERLEREVQKELDRLEVFPGTTRADPSAAVKIYRRPAAGRELPLPEEVRPPAVLKKTLDYLFYTLLPASAQDAQFAAVQPFLWNRTRAIRQDFIVQSDTGALAVECHERIARYHILCLHCKGGPGAEAWSEQQELEQLRKTLRSLIEFYNDHRLAGHECAHEPEFRAYNLLLHIRDPEALREVELLPAHVFTAPPVQQALRMRKLVQRSNLLEKRGRPRNTEATLNLFTRFFAELRRDGVPFLMACLAENLFPSVRIGAVKALARAYMQQHNALPLDYLVRVLGMDSTTDALEFLALLGVDASVEDGHGTARINKTTVLDENKSFPSPYSVSIVEVKRGTWTNQDIVDGRAAASAGAPAATERPLPALSPVPTRAPQNLSPRAPVFVPRDRQPSGPSPPAPKPSFTAGVSGAKPPRAGLAAGPPPGGQPEAARPSAAPEAARPSGFTAQPPAPKRAAPPPAQPRGVFSQAPPQQPAARAPSFPAPAPAATPGPAPAPATPPAVRRRAHVPRLLTALTEQLLAEGIGQQVEVASQEALQHEHRRRLRERRRELINVLAAQVCGVVVAPPLRAYAESAARDAAANVFYRRAALRRSLGTWRRAHARVADEARQTQRLHNVRSDLARRRASMHVPPAAPMEHAAPRKILSDNQLRSQYTSAKQRYDRLWRGGTFADALVEHLAWLSAETMAGVDVWTTLVSVPPSAELSTASRWLRHKFALQDGAPRTGTPVRIAGAEDGRSRDDVGLVVFECAGSEDVARLERLEHAPCVQRTRYAPRLLLIAWRADAVHAAHAHTLQPVRKRVWTDVAILVLDDAQRDTDQAFRQALDLLVPTIAWNDARRQRTLRQATLPLWHHWVSAADSCERLLVSAMAVLPSAEVTRATAADAAALATFALSTLTALSNLLLRQVIAVCDRRDDAPPVALPQVHRDTPAARSGEAVNTVLAELALEQLDDPAWRDDATVALLRANVVQCKEWRSPFPLSRYLQVLIDMAYDRIEADMLAPPDDVSPQDIEALRQLAQQTVLEVSAHVDRFARAVHAEYRPTPSTPVRTPSKLLARKRSTLESPFHTPSPPAKRAREKQHVYPAFHPDTRYSTPHAVVHASKVDARGEATPRRSTESSLARLREVIASTSQMLSSPR